MPFRVAISMTVISPELKVVAGVLRRTTTRCAFAPSAYSIKEILEPEPVSEGVELDENLLCAYDLSRREAEVLPLVLQFLSYKEIGERLFISVGTVRTRLIHIYQKAGSAHLNKLKSRTGPVEKSDKSSRKFRLDK
jgi:ATP/maltotriose-dependent transcriptional regulator MalT